MSIKEQGFTVPVNGAVRHYDGWCVTCDQDGCENAVIVSKLVIPYEYADKHQLDNGTFNIPWDDVKDEADLSEYLYENTDWRMDELDNVWCPAHSSMAKETAVEEVKRVFDGLVENLDWFKELVDGGKAGINYDGEGIHLNKGEWYAEFVPVAGDGKINLLVHNELPETKPFTSFIEAESFKQMGDMLAGIELWE